MEEQGIVPNWSTLVWDSLRLAPIKKTEKQSNPGFRDGGYDIMVPNLANKQN